MTNIGRRTLLAGAASLATLSGAMISAAPVRADTTNVLFNGGFEVPDNVNPALPASWFTSTPQYVSRDIAATAHAGAASVHIQAPTGQAAPWICQQFDVVESGVYQISAWCRRSGQMTAMIKCEFYTSNQPSVETYLGDAAYTAPWLGTTGWESVNWGFTVPTGAHFMKLYLRLVSPCDGWWDDVTLTLVGANQLSISTDQGIYYPEVATATASVEVVTTDGIFAGRSVRLAVAEAGKAPVVTQAAAAAATVSFSFPTAAMTMRAPYVVTATLEDSTGSQLDSVQTSVCRWERPTTLNADHRLIVAGQPYFPVIMYHVAPASYPLMPSIGVTTVQVAGTTVASVRTQLDAAHSHGLTGLIVLYKGMLVKENADWYRELIPAVKDHPATLAWAVMDEPDWHNKLDELFDAYRLVRSLDDAHPVYTVSAQPFNYGAVEQCVDVLATDTYPLQTQPIGTIGINVDKAKAEATTKPVWTLLQAFRHTNWPYLPTITEVRNMAHQAINHGSMGAGYYAMSDPGWELATSELWPGLVQFREELQLLGTLAVDSGAHQLSRVTTATSEYAVYQHGSARYVSVLNLTTQQQDVTVQLPADLARRAARTKYGAPDRYRPVVTGRDGTLVVSLEPHGCRLIEVQSGTR